MKQRLLPPFNPKSLKGILFISSLALSFLAYILPDLLQSNALVPKLGEVANQAIEAPRDISYISEIKTSDARTRAENSVLPIYLPADLSIARKQLESLRVHLNFITMVRSDGFADKPQKILDLASINLSEPVSIKLLALTENQWSVVQQEAQLVLEQVMRNSIREDRIGEFQRSVPTLISLSLTPDQAQLVSELVVPLVAANSLYSEELTQQAIETARAAVDPVYQSFLAGELIVQRGQVITPAIIEAMDEFGLLTAPKVINSAISGGALHIILFGFIFFYFYRRRPKIANNIRNLIIISYLYLIFIFTARLLIRPDGIMQFIFPVSAFGMTVSSLFSGEIGLILTLILSILLGFGVENSLEITLFYILAGICSALVLGRARRIVNFFWAALVIGTVGTLVLIANRLPVYINDWRAFLGLVGLVFINGLVSASFALLLQFLVAQILGMTTGIQLLDLSRPDHPLLQTLLREAPGTYQHSLQVANLAEQAAETIGADTLLVHVGSLYHDCGKSVNPGFFIENQVPGKINSHDDMEPNESARIIIQHVADGVSLAKKYRLPGRIQDFIKEHHGTLITRYQYAKAHEASTIHGEIVDLSAYQYPGPAPRSRETALLMLSDSMEAWTRSELPQNELGIREIARKVVEHCQEQGQLDDSGFSLGDLKLIIDSFTNTLMNTYHPRIQYPELDKTMSEESNDTASNN